MRRVLYLIMLVAGLTVVLALTGKIPGFIGEKPGISAGISGQNVKDSQDKSKQEATLASKAEQYTAGRKEQLYTSGKKAEPYTAGEKSENYRLKKEIPILMYHEIAVPTGKWKELFVTPETFAKQLDWLKDNGYNTVTLQDVYEHWNNKKPLPDKPVVITFDDGYRSMYETVLPLLKARNMTATFFLYPKNFNSSNGLTDYMVQQLAYSGMEIGSHTYSHVELTKVSPDKFPRELGESKKVLEKMTGRPVNFLCYPVGRVNEQVIKAVEKYGYKAAVTTRFGKATADQNKYLWARIRINYSDGVKGLAKKINK